MNILYFFKDYQSYMSQWQYTHIINELEQNGHYIVVYNPLNFESPDEANDKLLPFIKSSKITFDLFLNCESDGFLYASTVLAIKKFGIPTVLICFDNLHAPHIHKKIAPVFDLVWITSHETKWLFEQWGCRNILFQSYAANPFAFVPRWKSPTHSVCFIGSPYGSRVQILNSLTSSGVPCDVYSDAVSIGGQSNKISKIPNIKVPVVEVVRRALSFDIGRKVLFSDIKNKYFIGSKSQLNESDLLTIRPSVSFEMMQEIYSNNALSLNITVLKNTYLLKNPLHKIHLRTFEIPMCGGLEIASFSDELASYFEDGKEIVLYKSEDEFVSKSKFYLDPANDALCLRMKHNARKRAESEHTWTNRFNQVFEKL